MRQRSRIFSLVGASALLAGMSAVFAVGPTAHPLSDAFSQDEYVGLHGEVTAALRGDPFTPAVTGGIEPVSTTPQAKCGPGSLPETAVQGRVPKADFVSGRVAKGYLCNTAEVSHYDNVGGFHVFRYVDPAGHVCAIYDTAFIFPKNALQDPNTGTYVLDMSDPQHPKRTAILRTIAMQSPHESLRLNDKRGLLIATTGSPTTQVGTMDVYDLRADCRHPQLRSTLPINLLGHEGGFSPDGLTYWATVTAFGGLTAIDVSNPDLPTILWSSPQWIVHGLGISNDGNRVYLADLGSIPGNTLLNGGDGMTILDVSDVQARRFRPQVKQLSKLTWSEASIPQNAIPVTYKGHEYAIEFDEFDSTVAYYKPESTVGGVHIIDTQDPTKPKIVSRIRLKAWDLKERQGPQANDPGAKVIGQGYAAHYCSVPTTVDPTILACSMILSGLRIFDIRDPLHPREIAYFNKPPANAGVDPTAQGAYAMSAPAFDVKNRTVWYADANTGFYVVKLTNNVWPK